MLSITPGRIDSVVVISNPGLYNGEFTENGLIHIYTKRPQPGLSAYVRYSSGNETGDPGPFLYTKDASPNIEELGPDHSVIWIRGIHTWQDP